MRNGLYMDDGTKIDEDSISIPIFCTSCRKNENGEVACDLTRMDQMDEIKNGEMFCCFAYEPIDSNIDKKSVFKEMETYLMEKE